MVLTRSEALELGTLAPDFSLPDTEGKIVSLRGVATAKAYVIVFMCNHCPYVKHLRSGLAQLGRDCQAKNVTMIGISSNDFQKYPEDSPEYMKLEVERFSYTFPYLLDESQEVAKAYKASCTPDFYVLDGDLRLVYHGQFDNSRPGHAESVTGHDVRAAIEAVLSGSKVDPQQTSSLGCSIKWKPGNAPAWCG
ncbi:MAG: thioredoxin family protein [Myxococcales bacterium]|nr:thioredoxin family protein [Myxococcales bacterium]